jgi:hypothetical protein
MKQLKMNKYLLFILGIMVSVALFIFGKGNGHDEVALAAAAGAIVIPDEAIKDLNDEQKKVVNACVKIMNTAKDNYRDGLIGKEEAQAIADAVKSDLANELKTAEGKKLSDRIKELDDICQAQGTQLAELKLKGESGKEETLLSVVEKNINEIKASTKKGKDHTFVVKADTLRASVVSNPNALDLKDIGQLAHRKLTVYDIFRKVPVPKDANGVVRYVDWDAATTVRAAKAIAEGADYDQSTAKWATYTLNLEKVGDIIPMSVEMMYDAAMFAAELDNFLRVNVQIKVDTDLVSGNGATPNLNGIKNQIPNYTPAAAGIVDASIYDLIVKVREAITSSYGSKYNPDVALMNIVDINRMKLKKDQNNNYILPPFYSASGNLVDGVTVIECNSFTANTMAIGDRRFGAIYEAGDVEVETGFATGDFESDMMSLKARKRLNLLIRNVDRTGWLEVTDIDAALTTLAS